PQAAMLQSSMDAYYRASGSVTADENVYGETLNRDPLDSTNVQSPPMDSRGFFNVMKNDPRWVGFLYAKAIRLFNGKREFVDNTSKVAPLGSDARVILVADWASGIPRAERLMQVMRAKFILPVRENRSVHVIHLGDVYYTGMDVEYVRHLELLWPVK